MIKSILIILIVLMHSSGIAYAQIFATYITQPISSVKVSGGTVDSGSLAVGN